MMQACFAIQIFLCILFTGLNPVKCRRYEVEVEAVKLFGEDLRAILKRFRRTPQYMSILNDKVSELMGNFNDMHKQVGSAYRVKMEKHIEKNMDKEHKAKLRHRPRHHARRLGEEDEKNVTTSTLTPVEKLDRVIPGNNQLTASDSNHYRDIGFKFAGDAIHNMIRNMGPDDDDAKKSTRSPDGTGPTTTEHVKEHKVSNKGPMNAKVTPEPHTSESNETPGPKTPEPETPKAKTTEPGERSTRYTGLLRHEHRPSHKRGPHDGEPRDEKPRDEKPRDEEPQDEKSRDNAKVPRDKANVHHDKTKSHRDKKPKKLEESKESEKPSRRNKMESRTLINAMTHKRFK